MVDNQALAFFLKNELKMKTHLMFLSIMLISTLSFSQTIIRVKSGEKIQDIIDDIKNPAGMIPW